MTRAGLQWSRITSDTFQTLFIGPSEPLPRPRVTIADQSRRTGSAFYQATRPLRPDLRVSVGARYDNPSGCDTALTYSAGLEYDASPKVTWHMHLGTGKENPLPTAGDIERDIVPVEATTLAAEAGVITRPGAHSRLSANVFWTNTRDARILYNDPPGSIGPMAWISKAEDLAQWGAEIIYDWKLGKNMSWFANYMFLREDVTNNNEPLIPGPLYPTIAEPPAHVAAAGIRAEVRGTRVAFSAKYSSDYMALNRLMKTAAPVDSYLVFELKLA